MSRPTYPLLLTIALAVCAFFYHLAAVDRYEAELAKLKSAYAQAQAKVISDALKITTEVLSEREGKYADIHDAGRVAAVSIAKAESKEGDVDMGGLLPAAVSDALLVQYERICAGSLCDRAPGDTVQTEAAASLAGSSR